MDTHTLSSSAASAAGLPWQAWSDAAFARAAERQCPVLLVVAPPWCAASARIAREVWCDPAVVASLASSVVPVFVDAERRPDLADRYTVGAWPTVAFLTPDGEILTGGAWTSRDIVLARTAQVLTAWRSRREPLSALAREVQAARAHARAGCPGPIEGGCSRRAPLDADALVAHVRDALLASFDGAQGTFGPPPHGNQATSIAFAVHLAHREDDARWRTVATRTLDAVAGGPLSWPDGSIARCATGAGWSGVAEERCLLDQATLLEVLIDGAEVLGDRRYLERAVRLVRFVDQALLEPDGPSLGGSVGPNGTDRTEYVDQSAVMAAAWLRAAGPLEDAALARRAAALLERLVLAAYRPGEGVAHWIEAGVAGDGHLLVDQVAVGRAMLALARVSGNVTHLMLAEELARTMLRRFVAGDGALLDRVPSGDDRAVVAEPHRPLGTNAAAARWLVELAATTGTDMYADAAGAVLGSLEPLARRDAARAAGYAHAVEVWRARCR